MNQQYGNLRYNSPAKNAATNLLPGKSCIFISIIVLFVVLLLSFLAGCSSKSNNAGNSQVLRYAISSDPRALNPILASEMASITVNSFIFNSLVKYDENLEIVPDLAESWDVHNEGRRIVFHLRKNVKWHDGTPFTAEDVVWTMEKILDPETNTFNAGLFKIDGKNIEFRALDEYTVEAVLAKPFAPFLNNLTLAPVAPKHLLEKEDINKCDFNESPVGTGPFRFVEWKTSDRVVLKANPEYFGGQPRLDRIEIRIIPSAEGSRIALLSKQIDIAGLSAEDLFILSHLKEIPEHLQIQKWKDFTYFYFAFDLTNPMFSDKRVRQAINYAIDRKTLVQTVLHGTGIPISGPIPAASWAYNKDVENYNYNKEKAKALLKEAGWIPNSDGIREKDGRKLSFRINYKNGSASSEGACIQIQNYLKDVGIEVKLQALDFGALINSLYPDKFQSVVFNWVEPFDPDIFTEWHSSQCGDEGMNFMTYKNPEVDVLLEKARETMNREERKALYFEIQKKITEDAPYVWLWNQEAAVGVNRRVKGLSKPSPAGLMLNPEKIWVE